MLKNKIFLLLLLILLPISVKAAYKETKILYNNELENYDSLQSIIIDSDKNLVVVGFFEDYSNNNKKSTIAKYKTNGELIWKKDFASSELYSEAYDIVETTDGYLVVGGTHVEKNDDSTDYDTFIYKFSKDGEVLWHKETTEVGSDYFEKIIAVENGFVSVGFNTSTYFLNNEVNRNGYIRKVDNTGEQLWDNSFGNVGIEWFLDIAKDGTGTNESYYVVGTVSSTDIEGLTLKGARDGLIVKYNATGEIEWKKAYGGSENDELRVITPVSDGFIIAGTTTSTDIEGITLKGTQDIWLLKVNKNGEVVWQKNFGTTLEDTPREIIVKDDKYYVFGYSQTNVDNDTFESFITEVSSNGEVGETTKLTNNDSSPIIRAAYSSENGFVLAGFLRLKDTNTKAAPFIIDEDIRIGVPDDGQHGSEDPTGGNNDNPQGTDNQDQPGDQPGDQPNQNKTTENPQTGAFATVGLVILAIVGLIIYVVRRRKIYNI